MPAAPSAKTPGKSVVVLGAGGNIGSHLVPHLGRMLGVGRVTLIDRDVYEPGNLFTQDITARDVGKGKVLVQARRLHRIRPGLCVVALGEAVENLPLGRLRADVLLACLDSRGARQYVNQAAWRLGVPWIDAGVDGGNLLTRVNVYVPGAEGPCLECAWDERDYQALEQAYPCLGAFPAQSPTNAHSTLGALAAALQAIECQKLLTGQMDRVAVGRQILVDALYHKHYLTASRRNPTCRFSDHEVWTIVALDRRPEELTIGQALALATCAGCGTSSCSLRVEGKRFVRRLTCFRCGCTRSLLRLEASLRPAERRCTRCGQAMVAAGLDRLERLDPCTLPQRALERSLANTGFRPGEVFSVSGPSGESHYEISGDPMCS